MKLLPLVVALLPIAVLSWTVETRKSTLLSWDTEERAIAIGWVEERRDCQHRSFRVTLGWGDDYSTDATTTTIHLPYVEKVESLASSMWPAGLAGAILCQSPALERMSAKKPAILEVGAGLGLAGQVLYQSTKAASCQLTDKNEEIVQLLQESLVEHASPRPELIEASCLEWRDHHEDNTKHTMDIVLGTDVAYYFFLLRPLMDTIHHYIKPNNSLLMLGGQANRQSLWDLYDNLVQGSYNQLIDEHEEPWLGTTEMLLYRLEMQEWQMDTDSATRMSTIPIAFLRHATPGLDLEPLTANDHVVTKNDREHISMSF